MYLLMKPFFSRHTLNSCNKTKLTLVARSRMASKYPAHIY